MKYSAKSRLKKVLSVLLILFVVLIIGALLYTGTIWPNYLAISSYSVRGIDVSNHQQTIDWQRVGATGAYQFAFIKATEGNDYRDSYFEANWRGSREQGLLRGAYHFYTEDLNGDEQADNFIHVVPREAGMLPPVLDLEVSGHDQQAMLREVKVFLARLEQYYGLKPIIYTDFDRYAEYVKGNLDEYPLWIRDILSPIQWTIFQHWTFWQYGSRGHVAGIPGYVDLNVFSGNLDALTAMTHPTPS